MSTWIPFASSCCNTTPFLLKQVERPVEELRLKMQEEQGFDIPRCLPMKGIYVCG
jgi:hypothetical protein